MTASNPPPALAVSRDERVDRRGLRANRVQPDRPRSRRTECGTVERELAHQGFRFVIGVDEAGRGPLAGPVYAAAVCIAVEHRWPGIDDSKRLHAAERNAWEGPIQAQALAWAVTSRSAADIDELNILRAAQQAMVEAIHIVGEKLGLLLSPPHPGLGPQPLYPPPRVVSPPKRRGPLKAPPRSAMGVFGGSATAGEFSRTAAVLPELPHMSPESGYIVIVDGHLPLAGVGLPQRTVIEGDHWSQAVAAAGILAKVSRDRAMIELDRQYPGYGFAQHKGYPTTDHREALAALGPCPEHRRSFSPVAQSLGIRWQRDARTKGIHTG